MRFASRHVLAFLAFCSGAGALVYEIAWFQMLELVIGSSAVSVGLLLAVFMGGACLGSMIFPHAVSARRHPLKTYASIEFGIGVLGVLTLLLMPIIGSVYTAWSGYGLTGILLRGAAAVLCLLPPTMLMGATLPALARAAPEDGAAQPSWVGFFYASNIAGAVLGCLLAGFYLLRVYDAATAICAAAAANAIVGGAALALSWMTPARSDGRASALIPTEKDEPAARKDADVYAVIALSGFCAVAAETIWTRLLGLLLGGSVYTFAVILSVFLAGLGIGSAVGSVLARTVAQPRAALAVAQALAAAAIAWTAYHLAASLPYWPVDPSISSNFWFTLQLDLDRALWALAPPTLVWGASFPLALASVRTSRDPAKPAAGVYAANTLGAIVGALGASLFLVPRIGSQRSEQLLIAMSLTAALMLLTSRAGWAARSLRLAAVLSGGVFLIYIVPPIAKPLMAHGRYAATWADKGEVVYAAEGMHSTVAVTSFPNEVLTYHVAGKIQASNVPRDMRLQRMLGHLTSLISRSPSSVLVIGCGAGVTAGAVAIDPRVQQVTVVEIEPLVPQAAQAFFSAYNFDVLRSPKVRVRIDDGRHYLLTARETFDAITADPLDPWVKGAANLYTEEFFETVKQRLHPGGVVTMYMQLFETNLEAVKSGVAAFFEAFPNGVIWGNTYEGRGHDIVLLGAAEPLRIDISELDERLRSPEYARVAQSLAEIGMNSAVDLLATYAGRRSDLAGWLRDAEVNRDGNLRMQYLAGLALNRDDAADIYAGMLVYRRFPEDLFTGAPDRLNELRAGIAGKDPVPLGINLPGESVK